MEHTILNERNARGFMAVLLPAFFAIAIIFSLCTPRWQNSDEPFHYYYVKYLLQDHRLPTRAETYEAAHPPLYYLMAAAWSIPFKNSGPGFIDNWIRIMSALLGTISLYFLYRIGRDCFDSSWAGAAMAVFAAVNPMFVCASSVANNDIGVIASCTIALFLIAKLLSKQGGGPRAAAICGFAAGICCLFKITANYLPLFFVFVCFFHPMNREKSIVRRIGDILIFSIVFAAVCSWWYIRGYLLMGSNILFNPVIELSPNPLYIPSNFVWFVKNMMMSFWLPNDYLRGEPHALPSVMKWFYVFLSGMLILLTFLCALRSRKTLPAIQKHFVTGFLFCLIVFLLQQATINMQFPTSQARYMFHMYGALSAIVIIPVKQAAGKWFPMVIITAAAAGMLLNLIWAFALLLPCPGPSFVVM